jgi:hypothetical protein
MQVAEGRTLCGRGNEFLTVEGQQWEAVQGKRNIFRLQVPCPAAECQRVFPKLITRNGDGAVYLPQHAQEGPKKAKVSVKVPLQQMAEVERTALTGLTDLPVWLKEQQQKMYIRPQVQMERKHTSTCKRPQDHKGKCSPTLTKTEQEALAQV